MLVLLIIVQVASEVHVLRQRCTLLTLIHRPPLGSVISVRSLFLKLRIVYLRLLSEAERRELNVLVVVEQVLLTLQLKDFVVFGVHCALTTRLASVSVVERKLRVLMG